MFAEAITHLEKGGRLNFPRGLAHRWEGTFSLSHPSWLFAVLQQYRDDTGGCALLPPPSPDERERCGGSRMALLTAIYSGLAWRTLLPSPRLARGNQMNAGSKNLLLICMFSPCSLIINKQPQREALRALFIELSRGSHCQSVLSSPSLSSSFFPSRFPPL